LSLGSVTSVSDTSEGFISSRFLFAKLCFGPLKEPFHPHPAQLLKHGFRTAFFSDQTLLRQLLSGYKHLLVDKPGSWELFRSQFLMKNTGKKL